jgi:hypothetical protein
MKDAIPKARKNYIAPCGCLSRKSVAAIREYPPKDRLIELRPDNDLRLPYRANEIADPKSLEGLDIVFEPADDGIGIEHPGQKKEKPMRKSTP